MSDEYAEAFRKMPNHAEEFRNIPNNSETFRSVRNLSERKENHTLTVREVARMFEDAGVARTERSIINWCQPDKHGGCRLDCYFDQNERKYFITPQSVERAIEEERAKSRTDGVPSASGATTGSMLNPSETGSEKQEKVGRDHIEHEKRMKELEQEVMDLKITNKAKDYFIDQLKGDREHFIQEREHRIQQLVEGSQTIGELKTRLLQLEAPQPRESLSGVVREARFEEPHDDEPMQGDAQSTDDVRVDGGQDAS